MNDEIVAKRLYGAFRAALGKEVERLLDDPTLTDLMCNADSKVWSDRLGRGREDTGIIMRQRDIDTALRIVADHAGRLLTRTEPILAATLPITGERIAATIPPVTFAPTFALRKPPGAVFDIEAFAGGADAVDIGTTNDCIGANGDLLGRVLAAVEARKNILIAGGTGSGKTSLLSCLLQLESVKRDRLIAIEDQQELAIGSPDHVRFLTTPEVSTRDLVRLCLRYRPDRILIGEVRSGDAALEMIHANNTGASGSLCTIHANSAADALGRLEDLCSEVCTQTPVRAISAAIDTIVFMARMPDGRRAIREVMMTKEGDV